MDFVVKKSQLLRELQYVQGVVEKKTTVPILSNILLETEGNALQVMATDLDVTIRCVCPASVKVSGGMTVSARKLFDIVRLLPDADVHFKLSGQDWVQITCERSRFRIAVLSKENFPETPSVGGTRYPLPGSVLRHMISRCIFAITQEESRFQLNGALMLLRPGSISMVTTDGHRLAWISSAVEVTGITGETRNLIPRKTLVELGKLADDDDVGIEFAKSENHLFFKIGERFLVSRILSGQFPNWEMVIPTDNDKQATVSTTEFADAIRRVSVMADEQSRAVRFSVKSGQLDVSSNSPEYGEAKESLSVQYEGEPLEICFNAAYLLDFLSGLESEEVVLALRDEETQGLLAPSEPGNFDYKYVVMPMKL